MRLLVRRAAILAACLTTRLHPPVRFCRTGCASCRRRSPSHEKRRFGRAPRGQPGNRSFTRRSSMRWCRCTRTSWREMLGRRVATPGGFSAMPGHPFASTSGISRWPWRAASCANAMPSSSVDVRGGSVACSADSDDTTTATSRRASARGARLDSPLPRRSDPSLPYLRPTHPRPSRPRPPDLASPLLPHHPVPTLTTSARPGPSANSL